jgi:hypothetical protein
MGQNQNKCRGYSYQGYGQVYNITLNIFIYNNNKKFQYFLSHVVNNM